MKKLLLVLTLALLTTLCNAQSYRGYSSGSAALPSIRTGLVVGGSGVLIMGLTTPTEYTYGVKTPLTQQTNKFAAIVVGGGMVLVGGLTYLFQSHR
jgi:hypothetical protein